MTDPTPRQEAPQTDLSGLSFEEALQRLEAIVEDLEGGQMALEEALARFEEGMRLRGECLQRLKEAETKIEQVLADSEEASAPDAAPDDVEDPFA
ncbi:MAG: exodeoxyribonuclease VII small subunit [Armatimonadetes bacterium]|nr:exodeoxyribonuclease VII small subunit [Armatimonadota bacterium]